MLNAPASSCFASTARSAPPLPPRRSPAAKRMILLAANVEQLPEGGDVAALLTLVDALQKCGDAVQSLALVADAGVR